MARRHIARDTLLKRRDGARNQRGEDDDTWVRKKFEGAVDDFFEARYHVHRSLSESLYREAKRAKVKCEVFELGISAFIKALDSLRMQELDDRRTDQRHGRQRPEYSDQATKQRTFPDAIRHVTMVHKRLIEEQDSCFGALEHSKTSDGQEDQELVTFFNDVYFVLRQQSLVSFVKALCYWCKAYEAETEIRDVYSTRRIFELQHQTEELETKVDDARQNQKQGRNIDSIRSATSKMDRIRTEAQAIQLQRNDRATITTAEAKIKRAMTDMRKLKQKVDSKRRNVDQRRRDYMIRRRHRNNPSQ